MTPSVPNQTDTQHHVHVLPPRVLLRVFATLIGLTVVTMVAAQFSTGAADVWISLGIASSKAVLVAAYFMHLRYDKLLNSLLLVVAMACVTLFLILTLADSNAYQPDLQRASGDAGATPAWGRPA